MRGQQRAISQKIGYASNMLQLLVLIMLGEIVAASAIGMNGVTAVHHPDNNTTNLTALLSSVNPAEESPISLESFVAAGAVSFVASACYLLYFDAEPTGALSKSKCIFDVDRDDINDIFKKVISLGLSSPTPQE